MPLRDALRAWFRISLQTFGGPAGQIAVMHRALVDEKRWIGERRFLHALNFCMVLPGPEAQQLAIYVGWLLNGTIGGLIAGVLFVLPGLLALVALSAIYVAFGTTSAVTGVFVGLAPAVLAIVLQAVVRVGGRALKEPALVAIAGAAFIALAAFALPFPVVIAAAAVVGWVLHRHDDIVPVSVKDRDASDSSGRPGPLIADDALHAERPTAGRVVRRLAIGVLVWAVPVVAVVLITGGQSVLSTQAFFFSGTALVTFGGAYAVLAFVAQRAVEVYGWLTAREMVRGLGLAETTPGPLIMVVVFVAFLGAYREPGSIDPWVAAVAAAFLTTWVTFVPCFLFIFLGAPYVERLRGDRSVTAALTGITAAVVGVIANLACYFAVHTLFSRTTKLSRGLIDIVLPQVDSIRPLSLAIAVLAAVLIFRFKWSVLRTLGICGALGLVASFTPLSMG